MRLIVPSTRTCSSLLFPVSRIIRATVFVHVTRMEGHNKAFDDGTGGIDESLYSRQLITLGAKVMQRMAKAKVFISGMDSLGVEIAKNVALAGVKSLTVHDTQTATWLDLTNYYLNEQNVRNGDNRATACAPRLNELNRYSPVDGCTVNLSTVNLEEFFWIKKNEEGETTYAYSLVVFVGQPLELVAKVDSYCHANGIPFLYATNIGFFGMLFNDFGTGFTVDDPTGLELLEFSIKTIKKGETTAEGQVKLLIEGISEVDSEPRKIHGLNDDDEITIVDSPCAALCGPSHKVFKNNAYEFYILADPAVAEGIAEEGVTGGYVKQKLVPLVLNHKPLTEQLEAPVLEDFNIDWNKGDYRAIMLLSVTVLEHFVAENKQAPRPWHKEDAEAFVAIASKLRPDLDDSQKLFLTKIAFTARGRLVGNDSTMGGFIAQEVVKAVGRKYTPVNQWFFHEATELLDSIENFDPAAYQEKGDRYDSLRAVVGDAVVEKLRSTSLFMIGCGAIGCELMKIFAMTGISTAPDSLITVTDNDFIEKSNLNRQFLFRKDDLDKPKSDTAAKAILGMNPEMHIKSFTSLVSKETQETFSDEFFQKQDLIVNALDNVEARLYVDSRCVENRKALLESGTKGPQGHTMVVVPDCTINYGFFRDPPDQDFPGCTVKYFPFKSVHTIQWAKQKFQKLFELIPQECNRVREDSKGEGWWDRFRALNPRPSPTELKRWTKLLSSDMHSYEQCAHAAKKIFVSWYQNFVMQLLHNYPIDSKDKKDGSPFWRAPKKLPSVIEFDSTNELHLNFVHHLSFLLAYAYNVKEAAPSREQLRAMVDAYHPPEYVIKSQKKILDDTTLSKEALAEKKKEIEEKWENDEQFEEAVILMQKFSSLEVKMCPDKFEKDVDANHHIDFIFAASNLRCIQYGIDVVDRLQTKSIAGRIIPAMATTTACVSGLVGNELIKVVKGVKDITVYRNGFVDLARPLVIFFDPTPPPKEQLSETLSVTLWDKKWTWNQGNKTLGQFIKIYKDQCGVTLNSIVFNGMPSYEPDLFPEHKRLVANRLRSVLGLAADAPSADIACAWTYTSGGEEKLFENKIHLIV